MAAGLGFKTFNTGDVLSAADTNGYLMQGVLVFASAAARDAAITSPQEGQCCYLKDTDAVQTYSGTAWVGFDDSNAIQNAIVDAKGDIVAASGNDTPARLAVGNNGDTLVADSAATTGLSWSPSFGFSAGKNKIINGDFRINQRAFTSNTANGAYNFDRWVQVNGGSTGTLTITPQTFTPGTAPVSGYEAINYVQCVTAAGASTNTYALYNQYIEDTRTFAGQTVTLSFWAKATSGTPKIATEIGQNFGSGGSPSAAVYTAGGSVTLSTSWARYSTTISVPSVAGKTFGTTANTSYLGATLWLSSGSDFNARSSSIGLQNATFHIWGMQLEAGSVATSFQTATGTIQGELAACQRYYWRNTSISATSGFMWLGIIANYFSSTRIDGYINYPVRMRTIPSSVDFSNISWVRAWGAGVTVISAVTINTTGTSDFGAILQFTTTGAGTTDPHLAYYILSNNSAGYIGLNAEL